MKRSQGTATGVASVSMALAVLLSACCASGLPLPSCPKNTGLLAPSNLPFWASTAPSTTQKAQHRFNLVAIALAGLSYSDKLDAIATCISPWAGPKGAIEVQKISAPVPGVLASFFTGKLNTMVAYVIKAGDTGIVVFRGTDTDWGLDLSCQQTDDMSAFFGAPKGSNILMHRGFLAGYQALEDQLLSTLSKYKVKDLILLGHSLGGALAPIAALRLNNPAVAKGLYSGRIQAVFNIAAPRAGNVDAAAGKGWRNYYNSLLGKQTLRSVNVRDIVPDLLPAGITLDVTAPARDAATGAAGVVESGTRDLVTGTTDLLTGAMELGSVPSAAAASTTRLVSGTRATVVGTMVRTGAQACLKLGQNSISYGHVGSVVLYCPASGFDNPSSPNAGMAAFVYGGLGDEATACSGGLTKDDRGFRTSHFPNRYFDNFRRSYKVATGDDLRGSDQVRGIMCGACNAVGPGPLYSPWTVVPRTVPNSVSCLNSLSCRNRAAFEAAATVDGKGRTFNPFTPLATCVREAVPESMPAYTCVGV